jgi:hypothetical protein
MAPNDMLPASLSVKPPLPVEECPRGSACSICAGVSAYQNRSGVAVSCGQLQPHHGRCTEFGTLDSCWRIEWIAPSQ